MSVTWYTSPMAMERIVSTLRYKSGWEFGILAHAGPSFALRIRARVDNSNGQGTILVDHEFPIPHEVQWGDEDWYAWIFDCVLKVERHEAMEFFEVDGEKVYYPGHGWDVDVYSPARPRPR